MVGVCTSTGPRRPDGHRMMLCLESCPLTADPRPPTPQSHAFLLYPRRPPHADRQTAWLAFVGARDRVGSDGNPFGLERLGAFAGLAGPGGSRQRPVG